MKRIYRQPCEIKIVAWVFIALLTPIFLILFISYWQGKTDDVSALIGIPLLFAPFYVGAWWLLWHFRGQFILTDEGIMLDQLSRQIFLGYQNIHSIEERDSQLLPYLLLVTPEASLTISFKVANFSDLYANLRQRVSAVRIAEQTQLPLALHFQAGYVRQTLIAFSVYAIFTGVLSTGVTHNNPWSVWRWLGMWSVFIGIAGFIFWLNERTNPYKVTFDGEQIEAQYLFRKTRILKTRDIVRIERERQVRRIRYGATMVVHPLVITFENGDQLQIEEGRIWSFGYSPDRLLAILTRQF